MSEHIFFSYSRKNAIIMQTIQHRLLKQGIPIWTDQQLEPGTRQWKMAIEAAIETCQMVVAILSPDAKQSEWVDRELEYARMHGKPIIPLLVEGNPQSAVPFELISSQWLDLTEERFQMGLEKLIETLQHQYGFKPQSRAKVIHAEIKRINDQNRHIKWIALVTVNGLTEAFYGPQGTDEDRVSAMSAAQLSLNDRVSSELGLGNYQQSFLIGDEASCFTAAIGADHILIFAFSNDLSLLLLTEQTKEMIATLKVLL